MVGEIKKIFENIFKMRQILKESVSEEPIINAINNHEYIYIYYGGDSGTKRGYRTIRPFLLGTHKSSGNKVLRAWQDRGRSHSYDNKPTRKDSLEHDYWYDDGTEKPGWRLFRIDRIEQVYPIGRKFVKNGEVMIPPKYNENDKDVNPEHWVSKSTPDKITQASTDPDKPNIDGQKQSKSDFDRQTDKFKSFVNYSNRARDITKSDVEKIYNYVKRVYKKSPNMYVVIVDDDGEFKVRRVDRKYKIPEDRIVGDLTTLYSSMVEPDKPIQAQEKNFFKDFL